MSKTHNQKEGKKEVIPLNMKTKMIKSQNRNRPQRPSISYDVIRHNSTLDNFLVFEEEEEELAG
ncbi:MAG: hypothetical protein QW308_00190 [Candidatus Woesearchaeota archaeon]